MVSSISFFRDRDRNRYEPPVPTTTAPVKRPSGPDEINIFVKTPSGLVPTTAPLKKPPGPDLNSTGPTKSTTLTKDQTQALLKKPVTPAAASLPESKTEAQKILRQEGIGKPSDILGQIFFEKPEDILQAEGITKAEDILKAEKEKER